MEAQAIIDAFDKTGLRPVTGVFFNSKANVGCAVAALLKANGLGSKSPLADSPTMFAVYYGWHDPNLVGLKENQPCKEQYLAAAEASRILQPISARKIPGLENIPVFEHFGR